MNPLETLRTLWSEPSPVPIQELPAPQNLTELRVRLQSLSLPWMEAPFTNFFESALQASTFAEPSDYILSGDPLKDLNDRIHGHYEEDGLENEVTQESEVTFANNTLDEVLGRELMALVDSQDLDARYRAEALEATALALINPSRDNVRAILRALVKGLKA